MVLLSLWFSISPRCSWRSIRCNTLLRCVCRDPMNCGFMNKIIYEYYLVLLWIFICMIWYLCKSHQTIDLVWPTRLVFLATGKCLALGSILRCSILVTVGETTPIVLLPSRIKNGVYIILHEFIPLHHVILLNALLYSYELNNLDACWIVVDVWSNSSRCRIISIYLTQTWCLYSWSLP